jgi:hypothetical protein
MVATAGLSLTLDPMRKVSQNTSSLKPLGQLKPNCVYINTSDAIPNNLASFCIIVYYSVNISEQINEDRRRTPIDVICSFYIWKGHKAC